MATKRILKRVLEIITEGEKAPIRKDMRADAEVARKRERKWLLSEGVQGVGIGRRITCGKRERALVLKVYIERKYPKSRCPCFIPSELSIRGIDEKIPVDVHEIGKVRLQSNLSRKRPFFPGCGIGLENKSVGTLGCLVQRQGDDAGLYILSNAHILSDSGFANLGAKVLQPPDGNVSRDVIGQLVGDVPIEFGDEGFPNEVDAAIARVTSTSKVMARINDFGIPKGFSTQVKRDDIVKKYGATSEATFGTVIDVDSKFAFLFQGFRAGFRNLIQCHRFTQDGDSGSLILNESNEAVGLHLGASGTTSFFMPIAPVLGKLKIDLVTKEI